MRLNMLTEYKEGSFCLYVQDVVFVWLGMCSMFNHKVQTLPLARNALPWFLVYES